MSSQVVHTIAPSWVDPKLESTLNRLGAIPGIQSVTGPLRALIGLVVAVGSVAIWVCKCSSSQQKRHEETALWGVSQLGIGLIESFPIIGTLFHLWMHYVSQSSSITWEGDRNSPERRVICVVMFNTDVPLQW